MTPSDLSVRHLPSAIAETLSQERDRWFESGSLQQRVRSEPRSGRSPWVHCLHRARERACPRESGGVPARSVRRPHFGRYDARQSAAAVVCCNGLCDVCGLRRIALPNSNRSPRVQRSQPGAYGVKGSRRRPVEERDENLAFSQRAPAPDVLRPLSNTAVQCPRTRARGRRERGYRADD